MTIISPDLEYGLELVLEAIEGADDETRHGHNVEVVAKGAFGRWAFLELLDLGEVLNVLEEVVDPRGLLLVECRSQLVEGGGGGRQREAAALEAELVGDGGAGVAYEEVDLGVDLRLQVADQALDVVGVVVRVEDRLYDGEVVANGVERLGRLEDVVLGHGRELVADALEEGVDLEIDERQPPLGDLLLLGAVDEQLLLELQVVEHAVAHLNVAAQVATEHLLDLNVEQHLDRLVAVERKDLGEVRGRHELLDVLLDIRLRVGDHVVRRIVAQRHEPLPRVLDHLQLADLDVVVEPLAQRLARNVVLLEHEVRALANVRLHLLVQGADRTRDQLRHELGRELALHLGRERQHALQAHLDLGRLVGRRVHANAVANLDAAVARVHELVARHVLEQRQQQVAALQSLPLPLSRDNVVGVQQVRHALYRREHLVALAHVAAAAADRAYVNEARKVRARDDAPLKVDRRLLGNQRAGRVRVVAIERLGQQLENARVGLEMLGVRRHAE